MDGGERIKAWTRGLVKLVGLAALISAALAACGPFGAATVPQQSCKARTTGALGQAGGVVVPLAARDPTDTAHNVSALYALQASDGSLAWSCVTSTYAGWSDVQQVNGVIYALAGTEETKAGAATHAHAIYAIRPRDGKQLWAYSFLAETTSTMAFGDGLLFVITVTGSGRPSGPPGHNPAPPTEQPPIWRLLALHTENGALAWSVAMSSAATQAVAVAGCVVVPFDNGFGVWTLRAYREDTGALAWSYQLTHGSADLIALFSLGDALYAVVDRSLVALDGTTGALRWTRTPPVPTNDSGYSVAGPPQFSAHTVILQIDKTLYAYDLVSGTQRWRLAIDTWGLAQIGPVGPGQTVYMVTSTANDTPKRMMALDVATGATLWSRDVSRLQSLGLTPGADSQVYLTEPTGAQLDETVVALDGHGVGRWRHDGQSPYNAGQLLISGGDMYYIWQAPNGVDGPNTADVAYVTLLRASDGSVRWQSALPGVNGDPIEPLLVG